MSGNLLDKIANRSAHAAVIGGGYVGLPLALAIAQAGFRTTVIDVDEERVAAINAGRSYIGDVETAALASMREAGRLDASTDFAVLGDIDCISICVPTPLTKTRDPDVSYILAAAEQIAAHVEPTTLIVLESTTYPGTTREVILPMLEKRDLVVGEDFHLCFSPERIDPGNATWKVTNTPKVIGGLTDECTRIGSEYYRCFIQDIVPVGSTQSAEMVKLLENTFRAVNIALVNEVAIMCKRLELDTWEVIDAAATKPFGFMPFYPGPGLGGHCIPIDPLYLSWKLKTLNYNARFIELATEVNSEMPGHVYDLVSGGLNDRERSVKGSRVLVLGVAYKKGIGDLRESPSLDIIRLLADRGALIDYCDPHVPQFVLEGKTYESLPFEPKTLGNYDCVVVATDHAEFDAAELVKHSRLVVDTRNLTKGISAPEKIIRL